MTDSLRVLSYNIHKGFSTGNLKFVLESMRSSIENVHADLVLLQEVVGHHEKRTIGSQFEFLADRLWPHFAYGKNAVYADGHHGNAILSKYPVLYWENEDVSSNQLERRGLLHAAIAVPDLPSPVHVVCVHLGLFESDRRSQVKRLTQRITSMVPPEAPLIIGGDFNDWRQKLGGVLASELSLKEAFLEKRRQYARTFPSWLPVLRLDRIYYRGVDCVSAVSLEGGSWKDLSDHLPLLAEFKIA